jgi:hypothetical protein
VVGVLKGKANRTNIVFSTLITVGSPAEGDNTMLLILFIMAPMMMLNNVILLADYFKKMNNERSIIFTAL